MNVIGQAIQSTEQLHGNLLLIHKSMSILAIVINYNYFNRSVSFDLTVLGPLSVVNAGSAPVFLSTTEDF